MATIEPLPRGNQTKGDTSGGGGPIWSAYVLEQLEREDARKESLERRGLAVVTAAGAVATVLFGLAAFNIKDDSFTLPHSALTWLKLALGAYLVSAILAILTNTPFKYHEVTVAALRQAVKERWAEQGTTAEQDVAKTRLKVLESGRSWNTWKARSLFAAIAAQGVGVVFVAIAVWIIL
jgi:hypothetical protein